MRNTLRSQGASSPTRGIGRDAAGLDGASEYLSVSLVIGKMARDVQFGTGSAKGSETPSCHEVHRAEEHMLWRGYPDDENADANLSPI